MQILHEMFIGWGILMKKGRIVWLFLFFLILFCTVPADAKEGSYGRVLFISSYDYSFNTVPSQMKGIEEALDKDVLLNYEFMDTKSVNDEKSIALFHDRLSYKLEKTAPYDVVIVVTMLFKLASACSDKVCCKISSSIFISFSKI